jgi:hypothetical protein
MTLDQLWPAASRERLLEVGALDAAPGTGYVTGYTARAVRPEGKESTVALREGAAVLSAHNVVVEDAAAGIVSFALELPRAESACTRGWAATDEAQKKTWRAERLDGSRWRLTGDPVTPDDFAGGNGICLWEYGVGDPVRQSTLVSLRRMDANVYALDTDVDLTLSLKGSKLEVSADQQAWKPLASTAAPGGWRQAKIAAGGPVYLRVTR